MNVQIRETFRSQQKFNLLRYKEIIVEGDGEACEEGDGMSNVLAAKAACHLGTAQEASRRANMYWDRTQG